MIETEDIERNRSKGRFLNLFDWPGKSRKKLFSSGSTSELSEASKQENQNVQNPSKSWPSPIEVNETGKNSTFNPRSDSSCSTSTVTSDDGTRVPSVVARLMGLDSIPVPKSVEPRCSPDFDPFFLRSSRKASTWEAYENLGYVNLRGDYDGISWDHLDSRMNRERPINRFQTEKLPPRSAKPISVTHNRLLSPIRSPGFVQSRNPAYVMETASRMIEPSSRIVAKAQFSSSDSSSSLPMRIKDLKEKLEASQKVPSSQISNGALNNKYLRGKHDGKKLLGKSSFDGLKGKAKSPSVSAHAKANTIHKPSSSNRSQKEKMETKNRVVKNGLKESSSSNQKQNQLGGTSVTNQKGSKVMNKVVNKVLVESGNTSKKLGSTTTSVEKNTTLSLSRKKNLPRIKKTPKGVQQPGINSDKRIKSNITVNSGLKTREENNQKKEMDVISFTFSSPIKGLSSDSQSSTKKTDQNTESALSFNGDSLSILLEQKFRELTSKIESSSSILTQEEDSSSSISKDWVNATISEEQEVNSFSTVTEPEDDHKIEETELSEAEEGHDWELEYITEIISSNHMMVKELSLGMTTYILPSTLFDEIESTRPARGKIERKMVFDYVNQCLTHKCEKMFMGSCRGLLWKEGILFERKEDLGKEVKKEIERLKKMREMTMVDELVDNDMSSFEGRWIDYKRESYEEGVEIVSELVDDLVNELLFCF